MLPPRGCHPRGGIIEVDGTGRLNGSGCAILLVMEASRLEDTLIKALLIGDDPILALLRKQYTMSSVKSREFTGAGFYTHFSVDAQAPRVKPLNFVIDDLFLEMEGVENGALAMLFVRGGAIDFLEAVTIATDDWPDKPVITGIRYSHHKSVTSSIGELIPSDQRDLEVTRRAWSGKAGRNIDLTKKQRKRFVQALLMLREDPVGAMRKARNRRNILFALSVAVLLLVFLFFNQITGLLRYVLICLFAILATLSVIQTDAMKSTLLMLAVIDWDKVEQMKAQDK